MTLFEQLSFSQVLWLVPILLCIHNLEEALFMERWLKTVDAPFRQFISAPQFVAATILLTIAGFVVTYFGATGAQDGIGVYLVISIQAIMLFNAFAPHIAATLWYRRYQPGVITAILLNIPFSIYFFYRVLSANLISPKGTLVLFLAAPIAMIAIARFSQIAGGGILKLFKKNETH